MDHEYCSACGGELVTLGILGNRAHYRCRNCGWQQSQVIDCCEHSDDDICVETESSDEV